MDRSITYVGQELYEWNLSKPDQNAMVGLAKLAAALLGTSTLVNGLTCSPTGPATLSVTVGQGEIYEMEPLEASVCGTLPQDTTDQILKQGINLAATTVGPFAAPGTAGQSVNYLIEATYSDSDVSVDPTTGNTNIVLQFFNSASPSTPFTGPNGDGLSSNTFRKGIVTLTIKAGAAATTGSQVTPTPDSGYVGLYVITVANGQSTVTSGNIATYSGAPFITETLTQKISQATGDARYLQIATAQAGSNTYAIATNSGNAYTAALSPVPASLVDGMAARIVIAATNTGAPTINLNALGAKTVFLQDGVTIAPAGAMPKNGLYEYRTAINSGAGGWVLLTPNAGAVGIGAESTLASASTTDLGTAASNLVNITGTNTITSFGSSASINNPLYFIRFTGAASLTHNATSLFLPGGVSIQAAAGDFAVAEYLNSGNWRVLDYKSGGSSPMGAANSIKGNNTGSAAPDVDLTVAQVQAMVGLAATTGASGSITVAGVILSWQYVTGPFASGATTTVTWAGYSTAAYAVWFQADLTGHTPNHAPYTVVTTSAPSVSGGNASVPVFVEGFQSALSDSIAGFWAFVIGK